MVLPVNYIYIYIRWFCEPTLPSGTPRAGMGSRLSGHWAELRPLSAHGWSDRVMAPPD